MLILFLCMCLTFSILPTWLLELLLRLYASFWLLLYIKIYYLRRRNYNRKWDKSGKEDSSFYNRLSWHPGYQHIIFLYCLVHFSLACSYMMFWCVPQHFTFCFLNLKKQLSFWWHRYFSFCDVINLTFFKILFHFCIHLSIPLLNLPILFWCLSPVVIGRPVSSHAITTHACERRTERPPAKIITYELIVARQQ